ncbi:MAG: hypothetical protein JNM84_11245 [Planctomycetes bacterium]|nr:hypothetical protein [Planctomycetota bacterium]
MNFASLPRLAPLWRSLAASLLLAVFAPPVRAQEDERTLRVFIFAGQSNMVGSDSNSQHIERYPPFAGLEAPQPRVRFSYCIGREEKRRSDGWVELQPVDNVVGPELSFAAKLSRHLKAPIAIVKIAAGGTHLGGDWNPDRPSGFELYPLALAWVRKSLAELDRQKVRYRLEGFCWHQGENDMFEDGYRASYGQNLERFVARWRADLGAPELRFYLGELCTKTVWGMDNRANMHAISVGQRAVCERDPLCVYVPTNHDAVEIGGDGGLHYHYGTLGQLEHGVNYADAYLKSIGKLPSGARPLASWPYPQGAKVRLFVLAGHRNMEGERAFVQELKGGRLAALRKDNAKVAFKYSLGGGFKRSAGWEPLGPAGPYDTFGPELSFGAQLSSKQREPIAIAKFTHSGSQLLDWTPQGSEAPSRNLYPAFLEFVREARRELEERGHAVELAGIFYHLGENDMSFHPYRKNAGPWLAQLIAQTRNDLELPELKWFVSQQEPTDVEGLRSIDVVGELAKLAEKDPHLLHIQAFELPGREEQLVITTPGIVALGERLAEEYLKRR